MLSSHDADDFSITLLPRGLHRPKSGTVSSNTNNKQQQTKETPHCIRKDMMYAGSEKGQAKIITEHSKNMLQR